MMLESMLNFFFTCMFGKRVLRFPTPTFAFSTFFLSRDCRPWCVNNAYTIIFLATF